MTRMCVAMAGLLAVIGVPLQMASANLLSNPGFESGLSGWNIWGAGFRDSTWPGDVRSGSEGCVNDVNNDPNDEWRGIYQNIDVTAGLTYEYTAYLKGANIENTKSESWLELQWFDITGSMLSQEQSTHMTADQDWTLMGSDSYLAPLGAVTASVRWIVHKDSAQTLDSTDWHIGDDFTFQEAVPEPTVLGMLGIGLLVVLRLRSRRQGL
jgi:hypothetical protein